MNILQEPVSIVAFTVVIYYVFVRVSQRVRTPVANPILLSILASIIVLHVTKTDIATYQEGGRLLSFWLGPATVALGVPLYRQLSTILAQKRPIVIGVSVGAFAAAVSAVLLAKFTQADPVIVKALLSKSVTTPIAIEISKVVGADPELAAGFVIITGLVGGILGPWWLRVWGITSPLAQGLALGTAAHAVGTARALEEGPVQGSASSLAIGLAGLVTALFAPLIAWLLL